jgi:phage terminase small subunit
LTPKQRKFVDEYLIDLNATQAAIRAGYTTNRADSIGYDNLRKPEIQNAIKERQEELSQKAQISQERVLEEYARIAFLDPRRFYNEHGTLKSIHDLDDDVAAALAGMDVTQRHFRDDDATEYTSKIKIADKLKALDGLSRHLGLFEKDNEQQGDHKIIVKVEDEYDD